MIGVALRRRQVTALRQGSNREHPVYWDDPTYVTEAEEMSLSALEEIKLKIAKNDLKISRLKRRIRRLEIEIADSQVEKIRLNRERTNHGL